MPTTTVVHYSVANATVVPANGTTVTVGDTVSIIALPSTSAPITLFMVNGVDYAEYDQAGNKHSGSSKTVSLVVPSGGFVIVVSCAETVLGQAEEVWVAEGKAPDDFEDYYVRCSHVIHNGVKDFLGRSAPADFGLIFPRGNWAWDVQSNIQDLYFSVKELISTPLTAVFDGEGGKEELHKLTFTGVNAYGLIDTGTPRYVIQTADYGGGQVARWKKFIGFSYGWRNNIVPHLIGWEYVGATYPGGNFILDNLCIGVQAWCQETVVCGGFEDKLPVANRVPRGLAPTMYGHAYGATTIPWGSKKTLHYVYASYQTAGPDGYTYLKTPDGLRRIFHLYHVIEENATIEPDHGTAFLQGSSAYITAVPDTGNTLTLFTVDDVDKLTGGTKDYNGVNYAVKDDIQADIYVSASARYVAPSATDGTPYSFQCSSDICGTQTWSATGLPDGLAMDSATGLISGTIPYETAAADNIVTVTLENNGNTVTRVFTLSNIYAEEPIPGTIWTPITKLDSEITAMVQLANADVLIGTDAKKIYSTSDFVTFTPVFTSAATIAKIVQLASGRVIALGSGAAPDCAAYSDDNGANWTKVATGGGEDYRDGVELSASLFIGAGGSGGDAYSMSSTDSGATYAGWWSYYNVGLLNGFSKVIKFDATSMLALRDRGAFSIIKCAGGGVAGTLKYTIAGSDGTMPSCNFAKRSDGQFLFGAYNELHIGTADGETWALHQTLPDWGGIATPGMAYSMASEPAKQAVWVAIVGGLGITHVLRSVDDGENFVASVTDIDGAEAPVMIQLANRDLILGTNGTTNNLWKSEA